MTKTDPTTGHSPASLKEPFAKGDVARPDAGTSDVARSDPAAISAFLDAAAKAPATDARARIVFALDATMSRQPTWDRAAHWQAEMFEEAGRIGGLDVQLVYFRGFGECRASKFVRDARTLHALMGKIDCRGGHTQIGKVLSHAIAEAKIAKVDALVYVGDAMEERADDLAAAAGTLSLYGTKAFLFQEGRDPAASAAFADIARLTKGAHVRFDANAAETLRGLLRAVAAYATGGLTALEDLAARDGSARALITALKS
ncbi:VWA domain-containing protein [Chthonobacter rhizosphaerae]|uniref:VWA domain-containing protein n=1 Tax=Chthonobacter rhizosphaerae TaxID=2735553 RepID=UPI0015EED4A5|nr:VWA domain-containing protein [Chthonobacter rhizosphaerae]